MDWAYLEHLQPILKEFNPSDLPNKETFISYFWNGLRLLIRAQVDGHVHKLDNWEKVIKEAINAKAKAA